MGPRNHAHLEPVAPPCSKPCSGFLALWNSQAHFQSLCGLFPQGLPTRGRSLVDMSIASRMAQAVWHRAWAGKSSGGLALVVRADFFRSAMYYH